MAGYLGATPRQGARLESNTTTIRPEATVEKRLTGLLGQNSAYMQQAETRGRQQANARGLMSSSMGIGAVEGQRIAAALPIAQQDAGLYGQAALQDSQYRQQGGLNTQAYQNQASFADQGYGNQRSLNAQQGEIQGGLIDRQGNVNSRLQREGFGYNTALSAQGFRQDRTLQGDQFGYNTQLTAQGIDGQSRIAGEGFGYNRQLQSEQGDINSRLAREGFGYSTQLQGQQGQIQSSLSRQGFTQQGALNNQANEFTREQQARASVEATNARYADMDMQIRSDPNMNPQAKREALANLDASRNSTIVITTRGTEVAKRFVFSGATTRPSNTARLNDGPPGRVVPRADINSGGWR